MRPAGNPSETIRDGDCRRSVGNVISVNSAQRPTDTTKPQVQIPQVAWQAFEQTARGNNADLIIQRLRSDGTTLETENASLETENGSLETENASLVAQIADLEDQIEETSEGECGCATPGFSGAPGAALLVALGLVRRRRTA